MCRQANRRTPAAKSPDISGSGKRPKSVSADWDGEISLCDDNLAKQEVAVTREATAADSTGARPALDGGAALNFSPKGRNVPIPSLPPVATSYERKEGNSSKLGTTQPSAAFLHSSCPKWEMASEAPQKKGDDNLAASSHTSWNELCSVLKAP